MWEAREVAELTINPRNPIPAKSVEDGEDVNHGQCSLGAAIHGHGMVEAAADGSVAAEVEHGDSRADGSHEKGGATAGAVDEEEHVD